MSIIDKIFHYCVIFLEWLAEITGTSYKFVNVIIFCVLMPVIFISLFFMYSNAKREADKYKKLYEKFVQDDLKNF